MTLLSVAKAVAAEVDVIEPTSVVGSGGEDGRKLLRYLNKCGRKIMKVHPWLVLRKEQSFTAIAGAEQTGILPVDFDRFVAETFWNRSSSELVSGPVGAVEWQGMQADTYSGEPRFTHRGTSILINPAPAGSESLAFEYVSSHWCQSASGAGQTSLTADSDTILIDEELLTLCAVYEFLAAEDLPWEKALADYTQYLVSLTQNEAASAQIMTAGDVFGSGRHFAGAPRAGNNTSRLLRGGF